TPGGFGADGSLDEGALFAEAESLFDAPLAAAPAAPAVAEEPTADSDMATALAASLSLRGDTTSDPTSAANPTEDAVPAGVHPFAAAPRGNANLCASAPRGDANPFAAAAPAETNPFADAPLGDANPFADAPRAEAANDEPMAELPRPPAPLAPPATGQSSAWP